MDFPNQQSYGMSTWPLTSRVLFIQKVYWRR